MAFSEQEVRRTPCNTDINYINITHRVTKSVNLTLHDEQGNVIDLTSLVALDGSSAADAVTVKILGKATATSDFVYWEAELEQLAPEEGLVRLDITPTGISKLVGLFIANVLVYYEDELKYAIPYYVEVASNSLTYGYNEPITLAEVRLELRDTCPDANVLIDELEFTDAEIIHCIKKAVDNFNSIPPLVVSYTPIDFPYRSRLLSASVAYLLRLAAASYRRNNLRYSAGGVSVDDKNKADEYQAISDRLIQEFEGWAQNAKIAVNVNLGFSTFGSGYIGQ
jgi:hypothetical protein